MNSSSIHLMLMIVCAALVGTVITIDNIVVFLFAFCGTIFFAQRWGITFIKEAHKLEKES